MNTEIYRNRLNALEDILNESGFLLRNEEFPIYNLNFEQYPEEITFHFQPAQISLSPLANTILDSQGEILAVDNYLNRNFSCKNCSDRDRGIRGFLVRGRKKLLILHYTGLTGTQDAFVKKSNKTIFRTKEIQNCFQELSDIALQMNYEEFFFQEYPACHFSKNLTPEAWMQRTSFCDSHVLETIKKENLKAILVLGSSAILRWDREFCRKNQGKVMNWTFSDGTRIPFMITRSPDALLHAKNQSMEKYNEIFVEMSNHLIQLSKIVGGLE